MDKSRIYPIDTLVIHHSLGPEFKDADALTIQDWYDECGKGWGYENERKRLNKNLAPDNPKYIKPEDMHSGHMHPARDKETFSQAHYALHEFRGGWRLVLLLQDPFENIAWHAGNWPINQRSIGIEVCGDYNRKLLPREALQVIVDFFIDHAKTLAIKGIFLSVTGHQDHAKTLCPGLIYGQVPLLQNMFLEELELPF